jgi:glycosyltransferase involved in cell wall biosynthesis
VEHVEFLGPLSEDQMIEQYLQSNVFVCPSSIENSPNSLAEAQMLGVPNISSFVGGTLNMVKHGKNGFLYRFEEIEMLAYYIDEIFQQKEKASYLDEEILERHHPLTIKNQFIEIYNTIMKNS